MKIKFKATTKNGTLAKGLNLRITGTVEMPKGATRKSLIEDLKEYAAEQFTSKNFTFTPDQISVALI